MRYIDLCYDRCNFSEFNQRLGVNGAHLFRNPDPQAVPTPNSYLESALHSTAKTKNSPAAAASLDQRTAFCPADLRWEEIAEGG